MSQFVYVFLCRATLIGVIFSGHILFNHPIGPKYEFSLLTSDASSLNHSNNTKLVLYWTDAWGSKDFEIGFGRKIFQNCQYNNCYATDDRYLVSLENYAALLFHGWHSNVTRSGIPWARSPHQKYVILHREPPPITNPDALKSYGLGMNWTMTYRFDSDLVARHGFVVPHEDDKCQGISARRFRKKSRMIAWFVSNCETDSHREKLAQEIQKHIPVDVFGTCGKRQCGRDEHNKKLSSKSCYSMVQQRYKFYLSFENSYCTDYYSEKLYNILELDTIPVVYARIGKQKRGIPPGSIINVEDFNNVKELANYLKFVANNFTEYSKYFEWKKHYRIEHGLLACQLCQKLNEEEDKMSVVRDDLRGWWLGRRRKNCLNGKKLPSIVSNLL